MKINSQTDSLVNSQSPAVVGNFGDHSSLYSKFAHLLKAYSKAQLVGLLTLASVFLVGVPIVIAETMYYSKTPVQTQSDHQHKSNSAVTTKTKQKTLLSSPNPNSQSTNKNQTSASTSQTSGSDTKVVTSSSGSAAPTGGGSSGGGSSGSSSGPGSSGSGGSSGSSGSSFVAGAYDLGWQSAGSSSPYPDMGEDFLFSLQTENGSSLDQSQLSNVSSVASWVSAVHAAHDEAIISIGGSSDQDWQYACDSTNQSTFVSNLINYMSSNHFDGVDIDMEDDSITSTPAPVALWTGCAEAIINAAHATTVNGHRPIVSEDVITNWEGPWLQPYEALLDQFNLMTYGDTCASATSCPSFASDVQDTANQLCPNGGSCNANAENRFMLGLDMGDYPSDLPSCGYAAAYAKAQDYMGVFDWYLTADQALGSSYPCQSAIKANG